MKPQPARRLGPPHIDRGKSRHAITSYEVLAYSRRENFQWLQNAVVLQRTSAPGTESKSATILNYREVRQSKEEAEVILTCLMRREVSIDDLDKKTNEKGTLRVGNLRVDEDKLAIRHATATGNIENRIVHYAIRNAVQRNDAAFLVKLGRALETKQRPPVFDPERISPVARFLVHNWSGDKEGTGSSHSSYEFWIRHLPKSISSRNADHPHDLIPDKFFFMPPLCFFDEERLSEFCALVLGRGPDTTKSSVSKWVSRLRLVPARNPKITSLLKDSDGAIYFRS